MDLPECLISDDKHCTHGLGGKKKKTNKITGAFLYNMSGLSQYTWQTFKNQSMFLSGVSSSDLEKRLEETMKKNYHKEIVFVEIIFLLEFFKLTGSIIDYAF